MSKWHTKTVVVNLKLRREVSAVALRQLIEEAVESWGRSFHPDDPLFSAIESAEAKILNWHK